MSLPPPLLLLLLPLILQLSSLSLSAETVTHLPGYSGPLPFHLETGYEIVDEVNGVELFYFFIESEGNPSEDPLLLWLTGGPGCSAFSGLAFEIGPLKFVNTRYNGSIPSLVYNPYTWTKIANIIFLDSPVGTGFSFSRNPEGYVADDTIASKQVYEFVRKWLIKHPQFLSNHLYIAGDSYAGKVVPVIALEVDEGIQSGHHPILNLKGYMVGNPVTGERVDTSSQVPYAHGIGIISHELNEVIQKNCEGEDFNNPNPLNLLCVSALDKFQMFKSEIDTAYTLDPKCPFASPRRRQNRDRSLEEQHSEFIISPPPVPKLNCREYPYYLSYFWANNINTRRALHIKEGSVGEWVRCNYSVAYANNIPSSVIYHLNLTKKGYRALVYSGDKDLTIPFISTQAWIKSLNFPIVDDWRSWHVDGQVAGYTRKFANNLTFTTIKDYPYYLSYFWVNNINTRKALHIKEGSVKEWARCNYSVAYTKNIPSSVIYHLNLTKKGYRALVYSGDKDMVIPFIGTQAWIRSLNFPIVDDWKSWHVDGQVAGYTRKFANNLTFTIVKDAGHTAPEYKPENALMMLKRWISFKPL